jgi:hypothetical protein
MKSFEDRATPTASRTSYRAGYRDGANWHQNDDDALLPTVIER